MSNPSKKPLSSRKSAPVSMPDFFQNKLAIPPDVRADLEAKNEEGRWINYSKFVSDGNSHDKGWKVYKATRREGQDALVHGTHPDGIIRRGDSVLACRSKLHSQQHRTWLKQKADRQVGTFKKQSAEELRQMAKDAQVDAAIVEGYEENEE